MNLSVLDSRVVVYFRGVFLFVLILFNSHNASKSSYLYCRIGHLSGEKARYRLFIQRRGKFCAEFLVIVNVKIISKLQTYFTFLSFDVILPFIALLSPDHLSGNQTSQRQEYALFISLHLGANKANEISVCKFPSCFEPEIVF